jgi:hypothetical protein
VQFCGWIYFRSSTLTLFYVDIPSEKRYTSTARAVVLAIPGLTGVIAEATGALLDGGRAMKKLLSLLFILFVLAWSLQGQASASTMRFRTFKYIDKQGIGIEAFSLLIPADWQFQGGIQWMLDNPAMPAVSAFRVTNPNGTEELEIFPNHMFFWTNSQMLLSMFPIGARYFGSEVRQPLNPTDFIQNILVPRFRGNVSDVRIAGKENLPELARQLGVEMQSQPGVSTSVDGGKVKIEYQRDGRWMEESIYAVVESFTYSIQTMYGTAANMNWMGEYLFSFKAEKGKLDASSKVFQTMVNSFRLNPQWFNKYSQLTEYLIRNQIKQIQRIGEVSRIVSQTSNEISDMIMDSYQNRQAVYDRISTNFSQAIRGVDEYYDPIAEQPVELPLGYDRAWTNSLGEYILSDDYSFDPNVGSNLNWQQMQRRQ